MRSQPDEWYEYRPKGRCWAVYRMKREGAISTGEHVGTYLSREDAKSEVSRENEKLKRIKNKLNQNGTDKI